MKRQPLNFGMGVFAILMVVLFSLFLPLKVSAQNNCTPAPSGLIAWWPADGFALDVASTNNGVLQGGADYTNGEVGETFSFNGLSSFVQIPNNSQWAFGTNDFTIELWANFAANSGSRALVSYDTAPGTQNKWIFWLNGGNLQFHINGSLGTANIGTGAFSPVVGNWYHLAVTRNGTNYTFYTNGVAIATDANALVIPGTSVPLKIGQAENGFYFNGSIDEVSIYSRALQANEIAAIFQAGGSGKCYTNTPVPVFIQNPAGQTNYIGVAFSLSGAAMGTPRPQYQWLTNGVPLAGATNLSLGFGNPTTNQSSAYALVANNIFGSTTSSVANVTMLVPAFPAATEGFESGSDGWTTDNTNIWQVGTPTKANGAPTNSLGYQTRSGTNCAATVLAANYPGNANSRLISPVFTVPTADQNPRLRFWQWFSFDSAGEGTVEIRVGTNAWQTLAIYTGASGATWAEPSVDLSPYAGDSVQIAFHLIQNSSYTAPGWYVDDVALVTGAITTLTANAPVNFENGLGDWSVDNGVWAVGTPTKANGAPTNSLGYQTHSGTNCAATVLAANYPGNANSRLISPVFTVPTADQNPRLRFWQWFSFDSAGEGTVEIRVGTNAWQTLAIYTGASGATWAEPSVDLSPYAGDSVQIAFHLIQNSSYTAPGWYVDDVALVTGAITTLTANAPVNFENGLGDWSVDNGVWAVGTPTKANGAPTNSLGYQTHSGTNCAATVLAANYPGNANSRLISPVFTVPTADQNPRLRFWQWFSFDSAGEGTVEIRVGTNAWQTLAIYTGASGATWAEPSVDLSPYAGDSVQIAFHLIQNSSYTAPGWYVDDVALVTGAGLQLVLLEPISSPQIGGKIFSVASLQVQDQGTPVANWSSPITAIAYSSGGGRLNGSASQNASLATTSVGFTNLSYTLAISNVVQTITVVFSSSSLTSATNPPVTIDFPISEFPVSSSNSQVLIDPTSDAGLNSWTVNGSDVSYQHWYWLRIGANAPQFSLDTLSQPYGLYQSQSNTVVNYLGHGLSATLAFSLTGGANGSSSSSLAESLTIQNTTNITLNLHVFEYSDYDLSDNPPADTLTFPAANKAVQQGNGLTLTETIGTPMPDYYEGSWYAIVLDEISGSSPAILSDSVIPNQPGDQTFAHEWDTNLAAGQTTVISLTNNITGTVSTTPVVLSVALSGDNLAISWPTNGTADFQLQSTIKLSTGSTWSTVSSPSVINGDVYQVILPILSGAQYFRLQEMQE